MPLLTELVIFWLMNYKYTAPTALKFPTRLWSKKVGQKSAVGIRFKHETKRTAQRVKKILKSNGVRRCLKIFCGLVIVYVLAYSGLSVFGRYQPIAVGTFGVEEFAWAPFGFYDPDHAWEGSSYAAHHPAEKTGGWHDSMLITFFPVWMLDCQFIHRKPTGAEIESRFPSSPFAWSTPGISVTQSSHVCRRIEIV
jgi:hypothetical protein